MATSPKAKPAAVNEIVKVFRGQWYPTDGQGYTTAQFDSKTDMNNALHLVKMLVGWSAEIDPHQKMTIRVTQMAP